MLDLVLNAPSQTPRMHRRLVNLTALLLCVFALGIASAKDAPLVAADPALEARMLNIATELRCLVCQNQTLADSDADLALDLREQMRVMLRTGANDAQVRQFMTDRYGDFVLYRPPLKATTLALWIGPCALLIAGFVGLVLVLRRRSRLGEEHFEPDPPDTFDASTRDVSIQELAIKNSGGVSS
jgi:cytochrome c-type biogenesis protein CcmH